ncbi:AMP-binding enzyme domain-containing protein [Ditylenchus destructor]|uniref:AMP-binding enzyme domain-containing protein n=1 Tax=Ditylenchus destructor TaxID=166010 RepID=A0AAD4NL79_9BILA|nr:AMP-binding enzyme domain-containing protein [Ditylenchus destructor]
MPLEVGRESIFCLDFTRKKQGDFIPYEATIPELIYRKCSSECIAIIFDSEKLALTFGKVKSETEQLAAGLLSSGLQLNDRILICGYNHSQVLLSALGAARAGLVFSLTSPNFSRPEQLKRLLELGQFRAVVLFSPTGESDKTYNLILEVCPELKRSMCGHTKSAALPKLTHVILADEDHKHAGTFTLSEIYAKSSKERIEKLPNYAQWNSHKLAAIQFTMGSTGPPKAVGLTHYQLINGCRIAANTIGIQKETVLSCALPMFRIPVFCLVAFTPFLVESRCVFPEPSPLPRFLFNSINKYKCTNLLSNAAALRLLLKMALAQKIVLPSVNTVILLGERVSAELLVSIERVMRNAKHIAVGMLSTEIGSVPVLSDNTTNLVKAVGKPLDGYQVDVVPMDKLRKTSNGHRVGELRLKPLVKTKFIGYGPKFSDYSEWINTGDVVSIGNDGNIEIITHKDDLVYDRYDKLVEHWRSERLLAQHDDIRGVQVYVPDQFAVVNDFPRVNTKIQKYKLREMIRSKAIVPH